MRYLLASLAALFLFVIVPSADAHHFSSRIVTPFQTRSYSYNYFPYVSPVVVVPVQQAPVYVQPVQAAPVYQAPAATPLPVPVAAPVEAYVPPVQVQAAPVYYQPAPVYAQQFYSFPSYGFSGYSYGSGYQFQNQRFFRGNGIHTQHRR